MEDFLSFHGENDQAEKAEKPYDNIKKAQRNCPHTWDDGSSAIYIDAEDGAKCAICKKIL